MQPIIIPATHEHAIDMAPRLRLNDAQEVRRVTPMSNQLVLTRSIDLSSFAWTWICNGRPGCMFGVVASTIDNEAQPWLLTTDDVRHHTKLFWKHSRAIVLTMLGAYPKLTGYCDVQYEATVRWLTRLGFTLEGPYPIAPYHCNFYRFTMGQ